MNSSIKKSPPVLDIDLSMAHSFLEKLDPEGIFTFQTFDEGDQKDYKKSLVLHGSLEQHAQKLTQMNNLGAGVFVMVNRGDGIVNVGKKTCRTNDNVISVRALFADADGVPIGPILAKAPPPHILVESSPGKWHFYWLTNDTTLDEFKGRQQAIAQAFGTDPLVCDLSRVLRLPGFYHQKGEPFLTRLVEQS